ncbi:kinase-like protein [Exidia glandulosa HHB12029]|uniref:non-specific serine/threonine protein kinase n=1 Tax=Exidia glandulosa HHB12029 TaxID=1314781 RepID=A0A165NB04_EXIGL|nr:kinase-like protein [Exidia glandulosa HHB12029]
MPAPTRSLRGPVAANQDGPWSVSVAENPHDARNYSIYIKTPTHNITLTRNVTEIIDLHDRLRDALPNASVPKLPIDATAQPPQKRRSSFLHTLSRFASSSSTSTRSSAKSSAPSSFQSPLASPSVEVADPFASPLTTADAQTPTTSLASYLTTLSNDPAIRVCRPWRKFVRVRTDDLESVRVERAIKRVRSDLAAHHATATPAPVPSVPSSSSVSMVGSDMSDVPEPVPTRAESLHGARTHDGIKEEDEDANTDEQHAPSQAAATEDASDRGAPFEAADAGAEENGLPTPSSSPPSPTGGAHPTLRIPRSASADPDKASRLSRVWKAASSPLKQTAGDETETDDAGFDTDRASTGEGSKPRKRRIPRERKSKKVVIDDFEMVRVLGKGCAGKVLLVRHKAENKVYALKAITKRHVLAHQELQHTLTEQAVLKRMAHEAKDPFVVRLWWSFHDKENLFLVMDFHPGGDLATQLARWGRLGRDRARFYAAEIVEGVEGLHNAGVIYRDLKPENILIGGDGHIVLTDFGLSKEFPRRSSTIGAGALPTAPSTPSASARSSNSDYYGSGGSPSSANGVVPTWMNNSTPGLPNDQTNTFCGTAEYLAPEVIQGLPYSYEVDWWSFGTMLYEMLTGITPFWANNHSDMYVRVLQDELTFPDDRTMDQDTKSLLRGLLQRNPSLRMSEPRIKRHPYFSMIDWSHVYFKRYIPPYIPPTDPSNIMDTQNFDDTFLDMEPTVENDPDEDMPTDEDKDRSADDERTDGEDSVKTPPAAKSPLVAVEEDGPDVFDGYSYKARNSVIMDDDDDDIHEGPDEEDTEADNVTVDLTVDSRDAESIVEGDGVSTPQAQTSPTPKPATPALDVTTPKEEKEQMLVPPKSPVARTESTSSSQIDQELRDLVNDTVRLDETLAEGETTVKAKVVPKPPTAAPPSPTRPEKSLPKETKPKETKRVLLKGHRKARTERSGVTALDRDLGDIDDEDESATEREDDDWDFIEMPGGEDYNGQRGTSLFARGVVDRYRLAVFSRKGSPLTSRTVPRSVSGISSADSDVVASDSPTRRGRSTGLSLKTKTFLRAKSPPSTFSSSTSRSFSNTGNSTSVSSIGLLTPSPSVPLGQSLRTKPSSTSVAPSSSSDQSLNGDSTPVIAKSSPSGNRSEREAVDSSGETPEKPRAKKLKKGAEKMFALFGSPR